ncbi:MAG: hypothetical protein L0Y80_10030, partial [Ignavibacteriae bacterium]|nr:hypothetical protein [Ignavibacteriota bacterium]
MKLALVTCQKYASLTDDDRLLIPVLQQAGYTAVAVSWDSPGVRWTDFGCVVLRSTWDYHLRTPEFMAWLSTLEQQRVKVLNPLNTVRWNLHKRYLKDIEQRGIPIVQTHWVEQGKNGNLRAIMEHYQWRDVIVKPAVSATAHNTYRIREQELASFTDRVHEMSLSMDLLV